MTFEEPDKVTKMTIYIDVSNYLWLWKEKRIRRRPMAWIVNTALAQYRDRIEKGRERTQRLCFVCDDNRATKTVSVATGANGDVTVDVCDECTPENKAAGVVQQLRIVE